MAMAPPGEAGRTRVCPHCKSTILESADVCPACLHHLRFGADKRASEVTSQTALRVEGIIANDETSRAWEYDVVVAVFDSKGAELARKVVHVGALSPAESRRCVVSMEVRPAVAIGPEPRNTQTLPKRVSAVPPVRTAVHSTSAGTPKEPVTRAPKVP